MFQGVKTSTRRRFLCPTVSRYAPTMLDVKNLFKRAKLREDIYANLAYFTKYQIIGDERPDNVAEKIYDDPTLDWVILSK